MLRRHLCASGPETDGSQSCQSPSGQNRHSSRGRNGLFKILVSLSSLGPWRSVARVHAYPSRVCGWVHGCRHTLSLFLRRNGRGSKAGRVGWRGVWESTKTSREYFSTLRLTLSSRTAETFSVFPPDSQPSPGLPSKASARKHGALFAKEILRFPTMLCLTTAWASLVKIQTLLSTTRFHTCPSINSD